MTGVEVDGPDARVTLPKWLWGIVSSSVLILVVTTFGVVGWWFQHTMTTREITNENTANIRHLRETHDTFYRAINERTDKMDGKLDRIMELIIHYGGPKGEK